MGLNSSWFSRNQPAQSQGARIGWRRTIYSWFQAWPDPIPTLNDRRCNRSWIGLEPMRKSLILLDFLLLYFFVVWGYNDPMMNMKNTEAQVKARIINQINNLREDAEFYGFDYPNVTDADLRDEEVTNLAAFLHELSTFTMEAIIEEIKYSQRQAAH